MPVRRKGEASAWLVADFQPGRGVTPHHRLVSGVPGSGHGGMRARLTGCRSCGSTALEIVLSLGRTPLANALLTTEQLSQPEPHYPLELAFCQECTLVQLTETVPAAELFGEYVYFSSYSTTMLEHAQRLVLDLIPRRGLTKNSLVIEIASNDGYLLQYYQRHGIPVLGIEPAANVARVAVERGVPTLGEFFGEAIGRH